MVRAWTVFSWCELFDYLAVWFLSRADLYFANRDGGYRLQVSEDVGTIPITIVSRATIDREAFFYFDHYCKQIANHSFTCSLVFRLLLLWRTFRRGFCV